MNNKCTPFFKIFKITEYIRLVTLCEKWCRQIIFTSIQMTYAQRISMLKFNCDTHVTFSEF